MGVASSSERLSLSYRPGTLFFLLLKGFSMCLTLEVTASPPRSSTGLIACCFETCRMKPGRGRALRYMGSSKYLKAPFRSSAEEPSPSVDIRGPASAAMRALAASSSASRLSLAATPSYQVSIASSGRSGKHSLGSTFGKMPPDAGSTTSYFWTARCRNGTCSSGPNSNCIVCHVTKPCLLSAGMVGLP
jgi:hypothetical protein